MDYVDPFFPYTSSFFLSTVTLFISFLRENDKITNPDLQQGGVSFCATIVVSRLCIRCEMKIAIFIVYKVLGFNSGTIGILSHKLHV